MQRAVYRYRFEANASMTDVETSLALAALAVESLEGRSRFKLEAKYEVNTGERSAEVGAETDIGESIARIFTGYLTLLLGERGFRVERAANTLTPAGA